MRLKLLAVVIFILACGSGSPARKLNLYPTETPAVTQTSIFVQITTTPADTATARVVVVSETPASEILCITAQEAVYLRPSPNASYYPIDPLSKGTRVSLTGARDGDWVFVNLVNVDSKSGWIHSDYVGDC